MRASAKARYEANPIPKMLAKKNVKARYQSNPFPKRVASREAYRICVNQNDMRSTLARAARYHI